MKARIRRFWVVAFLMAVIVQLIGVEALAVGPARVDYSLAVSLQRLRQLTVQNDSTEVSVGQLTPGVAPGSILQKIISRAKANDLAGAQTMFSENVVVSTHMGKSALVPIGRSGLALWLQNVVASLRIDADQVEPTPGGFVERALVDTNQLHYVNISNAQAIYTVDVRNGEITSVDVSFTPDSVAHFNKSYYELSARSSQRGFWGDAIILASIALPAPLIVLALFRRHYVLAVLLLGGSLFIAGKAASQMLNNPNGSQFVEFIPSDFVYPTHALIGATLNQIGLWPSAAALQWAKAASHTKTSVEVAQAADGIATAYRRSHQDGQLLKTLCTIYRQANPKVQGAISEAGIQCP